MGLIRQLVANTLERVGIGIGSNLVLFDGTAKLKGFRPYPAIKIPNNLDHEWQVGLYWYLKRIEGRNILDTGYMAHIGFTKILYHLHLRITGVDLQQGDTDKINCIQAPVWNMPIPEFSIDTVIANSLLEHLGLDYYEQPRTTDATNSTLLEFHRVLKPRGLLLLQVPYGAFPIRVKHKGKEFYVPWISSNLRNLEKHFTIEEKTYYIRARGKWIEVSETIANHIVQGGGFPPCIVYIKARKMT